MTDLDEASAVQALIERLEQFLEVAGEKGKFGTIRPSRSREVDDQLERQLVSVRRICNEVQPGLGDFQETNWTGYRNARSAARTAIGVLRDKKDLDEELRAAGLRSMPVVDLHTRVWESAKSLWGSQQHAEALHGAWKAINADLQQRLGRRDLSDEKLVSQAFGLEDKRPRLHLPGDHDSDTWKSRQRGLLNLAQACVAGIRNPAAHEADYEIPYPEAVEQLACLSLLARWIDQTNMVEAES